MHGQEREVHVRARVGHVAACGGWNKAVKASTGSWDDGEDPGGARRSCRGTKVYRYGLEKTRTAHHRRTENGTAVGGGKRPEGID
jgi:hypothetical protein